MISGLSWFVRLLWTALHRFTEDHGTNHAAAVAYFSLLSLPPFLLLAGRVLARLLPDADAVEAILLAIAPYLPIEIAPSLTTLVGSLHRGDALAAVAAPLLLWLASHAFWALEIAINEAFGTTPHRRYWISQLKAFIGLTGGVLLLGAAVVAGHVALWLDGFFSRTGAPLLLSPKARFVSSAALILVTFGVFTLFYKWLPSGRVAWWSAARAALVALALWEIARLVFSGLLSTSPGFGFFSGAMAATVAVLGWVYVAVAVTIYGAEVAALLNGNRPLPTKKAPARR